MEREALTEADVVARAGGGDRRAFGELIRRYQDAVFGLAYSHTRSFADAEDIAQEAFLAAWEGLPRLRDASSFGPWLHGITLNKVRMHLRAVERRRRSQERHSAFARTQTPGAETHAREEPARDAVTTALSRLSPARRVAATLYYINGYSCQQVSSFLGVPLGTVKRRLFEARQGLKERLAMVEKKLKAERPKPSFSRRVLERIDSVKVAVAGERLSALLVTDKKKRSLFMYTGHAEAASINTFLQGVVPRRPMTHDLLLNVVRALGGQLVELVVSSLKDGVFYANLVIRQGRDRHEIDCRPSDGVAIALRAAAPMYVHNSVVEQNVMRRKDGEPLSPRAARRRLEKMAEAHRGDTDVIKRLREEVAKKPRCLEAQLALAFKLRFASPEEARALLTRIARTAKERKTKARAHVGLAGSWWFQQKLEKAQEHLHKASRLYPGYAAFMDVPVDAYIKAMRLFEDWGKTGEAQVLDQALHWYETYLRNKPLGEGTPLLRLPSEVVRKLEVQERFQQLEAKYGIWSGPGAKTEEPKAARQEKVA
jgi:RNA polymerase sigma-70 factor (ECF subfamily)